MIADCDIATSTGNGIQVFPSASEIPTNLLRFHIRFNEVPEVFDIGSAIRLIDAAGVAIDHVFLDLDEGLWSADGLTLTVMLHPGRIKTGLTASRALGNAFQEHNQYELQLRCEHLPSLHHVYSPSSASAANEWACIKRFTAIAAVDTAIDAQSLLLSVPNAHSLSPLSITFPRSIDRLGAENYVRLNSAADQLLDVQLEVGSAERAIHFVPRRAWPSGPVTIHFSGDFEDVSGNRLSSAFATPMQIAQHDANTIIIPIFIGS
jgi:hypothetical protein